MQTFGERIQHFNQRGRNWRFQRVISLDVHLAEFRLLKGSSHIKLPDYFQKKEAVINVKKKDNHCFKWCALKHLNLVKSNAERILDLRGKTSQLNFTGIKFLVKLRDIDRFEKQNEGGPETRLPAITVNVFGLDGTKVYPLKISEKNIREGEENKSLIFF